LKISYLDIKPNVPQQSSSSSLSSTSNISLTNPPLAINDVPSAMESIRIKLNHRPAI